MKIAETVTFGGGRLDRAAELRKDTDAIARLMAEGATQSVVFWRGKPLMDNGGVGPLSRLPLDHPMVRASGEALVFLGITGGAALFAADLSDWEPEEGVGAEMGAFLDPSQQAHPDAAPGQVFCELRAIMLSLDPTEAELAATGKAILGWHASHKFCAKCGAQSVPVDAGWMRRCPSCRAGHFPRTDPVVIMLVTRDDAVLLGRSHGWPEGMYSLLAGFVEPGETIEAAVRREVAEETGIAIGRVDYLASQPWAFPSSLMIGCAAEATSGDITIDPEEIDDAHWFSRSELHAAMQGRHPTLKPARRGAIAHFILHNWLADRLD